MKKRGIATMYAIPLLFPKSWIKTVYCTNRIKLCTPEYYVLIECPWTSHPCPLKSFFHAGFLCIWTHGHINNHRMNQQ